MSFTIVPTWWENKKCGNNFSSSNDTIGNKEALSLLDIEWECLV
jgi:hypothetical protein